MVADLPETLSTATLGGRGVDELYRRHAPDARRLAYLLTGDHAAAQDIAHDAFLKFVGRPRSLRSPDAASAYLRRVVVNTVASQSRSRRRETARMERRARLDAAAEGGTDDNQERGPLWAALQRLPDRQRAAIVLRYWLDLSEDRTAELLGCPVGTVKSLASRGLATMREVIEHD